MLDDPSPFVRESAVRVAGYFGYAACVDKVLACCQDPDESVRAAALEHLPYFDDDRALPALTASLAHDPPRARAAAARALGAVYESAARKLLAQALNDPDSWVRYFAVMGLGRHGDPAWLDALIERARDDEAVHVAVAAADAIAVVGNDNAVAALAAMSRQDDDRGLAAAARAGPHSQRCRRRTPAGRASSGRLAAPADGDRGV